MNLNTNPSKGSASQEKLRQKPEVQRLQKRVDRYNQPIQQQENRQKQANLTPRINLNPQQVGKDHLKKWAFGLIGGSALASSSMAWWIFS